MNNSRNNVNLIFFKGNVAQFWIDGLCKWGYMDKEDAHIIDNYSPTFKYRDHIKIGKALNKEEDRLIEDVLEEKYGVKIIHRVRVDGNSLNFCKSNLIYSKPDAVYFDQDRQEYFVASGYRAPFYFDTKEEAILCSHSLHRKSL